MVKKPRVLYLTPSMTQGGAERQLSDLLRLHMDDVTQHLALIYPLETDPFFYRDDIDVPVTFLDKRPGKWGRARLGWRYARLLKIFQPDIVHAYLWHAMDIVRAFHRVIPLRRPLLIVNPHAHLDDAERIHVERQFFRQTDHVVAVSPMIAEEYRAEVPGSAGRITIIGNGVDAHHFAPGDRSAARAMIPESPPLEATLLLFMGRFAQEKNLDTLLRAVAILRRDHRWPDDAHLLCIGRTVQPDYAAALWTIIQQESLADIVRLCDAQPEVLPYYHACDALLLPSHYESLGNVVLEAAACARPSLISEAVNRNHLVKHGETGWVVPADDAHQVAAGLEHILQTPRQERDRIGEAARAFLLPQYRAESMAEQYLSLYNRLIESKKG